MALYALDAPARPMRFGPPADLLSPPTENATRVRLAAGVNGDFHVAYLVHDKVNEAQSPHENGVAEGAIYYARFRKGRWSPPVLVSGPDADSVPNQYADVAGDRDGTGYVVYVDRGRKHLVLATIRDGHLVTQERRGMRHAVSANVSADPQGNVWVMYRDKAPEENALLVRRARDKGWQAAPAMPALGVAAFGEREAGLVAGSGGQLHASFRFRSRDESPNRLAMRRFDGKRWLDDVIAFSPTAGKAFAPP